MFKRSFQILSLSCILLGSQAYAALCPSLTTAELRTLYEDSEVTIKDQKWVIADDSSKKVLKQLYGRKFLGGTGTSGGWYIVDLLLHIRETSGVVQCGYEADLQQKVTHNSWNIPIIYMKKK